MTPAQQTFLDRAEPFLIHKSAKSEWPGTKLSNNNADVSTYRLTPELKELFLEVNGLYDWQAPHLPEDAAFYRADNSLLLGSIAHETDGFLELTHEEYASLYRIAPEIKIRLKGSK